MVRHKRIVVAASAAIAAGVFSGAALAPAAGDRHATGAAAERMIGHTADGIRYVRSGPQCRAGKAGHERRRTADPSEY
jgi:uncharacterized membrane protein